MALPNIFTKEIAGQVVQRIESLQPTTTPQWGKMTVAQMLAHCSVAYEMVFENIHAKPNPLMRFLLKTFVKSGIVNEVPYKKNSQTAPAFLITGDRDFATEKNRLVNYVNNAQALGEPFFDHKESLSFGTLTVTEWNNLFYKHLDHHLTQFGV
jgi:hypothetical protein